MKATIKLIRNVLEKFNLIANRTVKNLALHQQLIVLNRSIKRPQIKTKDRFFISLYFSQTIFQNDRMKTYWLIFWYTQFSLE